MRGCVGAGDDDGVSLRRYLAVLKRQSHLVVPEPSGRGEGGRRSSSVSKRKKKKAKKKEVKPHDLKVPLERDFFEMGLQKLSGVGGLLEHLFGAMRTALEGAYGEGAYGCVMCVLVVSRDPIPLVLLGSFLGDEERKGLTCKEIMTHTAPLVTVSVMHEPEHATKMDLAVRFSAHCTTRCSSLFVARLHTRVLEYSNLS